MLQTPIKDLDEPITLPTKRQVLKHMGIILIFGIVAISCITCFFGSRIYNAICEPINQGDVEFYKPPDFCIF